MTLAHGHLDGAAAPDAAAADPCVRVDGLVVDGRGPVSLELARGDVTVVVSRPPCHAHALMSAVAGLRPAEAGAIEIAGRRLSALESAEARRARFALVGYVLRDIGLDGARTVAENIASPIGLAGREHGRDDAEWLARLAQSFGLVGVLERPAGELEPGLQQRVAIARALATRPALVYAEEPVARLGERDGRVVLALLRTIAHEYGIALAIATDDATLASGCDRVLALREGRIVADRRGADAAWIRSVLDDSIAQGPRVHPAG